MAKYIKDPRFTMVFIPGLGRVTSQFVEGDFDGVPGLVRTDEHPKFEVTNFGPMSGFVLEFRPHDMVNLTCRCGLPSEHESGWCGTDFCIGEPKSSKDAVFETVEEALEGPVVTVESDKLGEWLSSLRDKPAQAKPKEQPKKKGRPPKAK